MKSVDDIKKLIKKAVIYSKPQVNKVVLTGLLRELDKVQEQKSALTELNIWRKIMKNRKIQLATAATVILIVSLLCYWSDTSIVTKAYGISDTPELLYSADTIYMKGTMYFRPQQNTGGKPVAVATEYWLDLANGRWRMTWPGQGGGPGFFEINVEEKICDGGEREIVVNHNRKTFYYNIVSEFQRQLFCLRHAKQLVKKTIGDPELFENYRNVGHEEINGKKYDIWEVLWKSQGYIPASKMRSWLSPETGEFAKVTIWTQQRNGTWKKSSEIDSVRRNIEIPNEIFTTTPPKGYRPERPRFTPANGLTVGRSMVLSISFNTHIIFAMSDGSIIVCWSCDDKESAATQAILFEDLKMGGALPKLPFEVSALKAIYKGEEIIYDGYHLAQTEKKSKFYEWGIYIPAVDIKPEYYERMPYSFIYTDNAQKTNGNIPSSGSWRAELTINNKKDFDKWIHGAMAELSGNGIAPENVTYENVTKVIGDLRDSPRN